MLKGNAVQRIRLSSRQLTTITTSSANSTLRKEQQQSQAHRNPYRPEPPPLFETKQPRKPIVKNLKFGRIAEAASAATETARAVLADSAQAVTDAVTSSPSTSTSASSSSTSRSTSAPRSGLSQSQRTEYEGNSSNSRYNPNGNGRRNSGTGGPLSSSAFWLVATAAAGAGIYLYISPSAPGGEAAIKARELAASNEPYDSESLQRFIATLPPAPEDDPSLPMQIRMENWVKSLQTRICTAIEQVERGPCHSTTSPEASGSRKPGVFLRDSWLRKEGGEGISCVLQQGRIFEKSGVNVSVVHGTLPPAAVKAMSADHDKHFKGWYDGKTPLKFKACGLSCVMHPYNPSAPTVHFNYRYFEVEDPADPGTPKAWWFGGGSDLTPSYLFTSDATHFHTSVASRCPSPSAHSTYKAWCDRYFHIKHRNETRGIGGIFFDDLSTPPGDDAAREDLFSWIKGCGEGFVESYVPIVERRKHANYTERMKQWQQLRRGRYVEFNLVYDRGTQFGLRTPGARIESILMSLPLTARWEYYAKLGEEEGSREKELLEVLREPRDWLKADGAKA